MEITSVMVLVIGAVASVLVQGVRLFAAWRGKEIGRLPVTIVLMVIAFILAYFWTKPILPAWPVPIEDPMAYAGLIVVFIGQIIVVISAVFGFAKIIYDLLLKKVFELLEAGSDKIGKIAFAKSYSPPDGQTPTQPFESPDL